MKLKKMVVRPLIVLLTASQCMTAFAGTWVSHTPGAWKYQNENGTFLAGEWFRDPGDGRLYFLDETGLLAAGWHFVSGNWYFFNTSHDGTYGAAFEDGWHWIEGYCYYFGIDGKMFAESITPDGFLVNAEGRWTENGSAVYIPGKGIQTTEVNSGITGKTGQRSGSSGGGSSSKGNGGGGSAATKYYEYSVIYVGENGEELLKTTAEVRKNTLIEVEEKKFKGYTFVSGPRGNQKITSNHMVFTLIYKKADADSIEVPGKQEQYHYTIRYMGSDGKSLGYLEGTAQKGSTVEIPTREFDGYTEREGQEKEIQLINDNQVIQLIYEKDSEEEAATPSEPEERAFSYTLRYIDRDTGGQLRKEAGTAKRGSLIIPDQEIPDYVYAADYVFELEEDESVFTVYLIKAEEEGSLIEVEYTITCKDQEGAVIKVSRERIFVGQDPVEICPDYQIPGYERISSNRFTVTRDGTNHFIMEYARKNEIFHYLISCIDIDTLESVLTETINGAADDYLDISGICPEGYERAGNPPDTVFVSRNPINNHMLLYFKKKSEVPDMSAERPYTIRFRAYGNRELKIIADITGTARIGEKLPVYYPREVTTSDGQLWTAINDSPRIFTVKDQEMNVFLIEFQEEGIIDEGKHTQSYSIRYVAEDTSSVLGISVGFADIGDVIPYYNGFSEYGFPEGADSHTITDGENNVEVQLKRVAYPGHEPNASTGKFDGCEWSALFVDQEGRELFPAMNGFTVAGDILCIKYPDVVEEKDTVYRAERQGPFQERIEGTAYRQFIIQYTGGSQSESKLESWKNAAQEKKDEFYGTSPLSFFIAYREQNSWNDIALKIGVAHKGTLVNIEAETIEGWLAPNWPLGTFTLDSDEKKALAQYGRADGGTSAGYFKRDYQISFLDQDGNELFSPYQGVLAFKKGNDTCEFPVFYPESFYDKQGNRYEAEEKSPQVFTMSALEKNQKTIKYRKVFENERNQFLVTGNSDVNRILGEFAAHTYDAGRHEFYLIGKDYDPHTAEISDVVYENRLTGYTNEVVDTFTVDETRYIVSLVGFSRSWNEDSCIHEWGYTEELEGECQTASIRTVRCKKCGKEVSTILPAVGHTDGNYDSICDRCGVRLTQNLGDEITVTWDTGSLGFGRQEYGFVCIDTNYQGTGNMLYLCTNNLEPVHYGGVYTEAFGADYDSSLLKHFLDDTFANGLSVRNSLQDIDGSAASILTKEEFETYRAASMNQYPFPIGQFLTKGNNEDHVLLSDGTFVSKEEAGMYPVRPVLLLEPSNESGGVRTGIWREGDYQARELGDKIYLFRCVDENYRDKTNTDKGLALFLCDTVIPANEGLGFVEEGLTQATRFFGNTNNYKYSHINQWLSDHKTQTGNLVMVDIGIQNEYTGSTEKGRFQNLDLRTLTPYPKEPAQVMYSNLFIPSLEEAAAVKDYLWKFHGAEENNAADIMNNYCESYWLRTPVHGTTDRVYTVNLRTGIIEPKAVSAADGNEVSDTGIRPMYVVEQAY